MKFIGKKFEIKFVHNKEMNHEVDCLEKENRKLNEIFHTIKQKTK